MEILFALIVAAAIWYFWGPHKRDTRRPDAAINPERGSADNRPDVAAHLDVRSTAAPTITPVNAPRPDDYEFEIEYADRTGSVTKRRIAILDWNSDGSDIMIRAWCQERGAERTFRSSRIVSCQNLWSGRRIKNLGQYLKRGAGLY